MTIAEVKTTYEPRKVITFDQSGNKVVKPYRNVKQLYKSIYSTEPKDDGYYYKPVKLFAFYGDNIGIEIGNSDDQTELDKIIEMTDKNNIDSFEGFINWIKGKINNDIWVNLAELEYLKAYKPELIAGAEKARAAWRAKQDERRRQEEAERNAREQAEHDAENARAFEKINKAIEAFRTSGQICNDDITIWTSLDDYKDYTVLTYLLDKYEINVPIKTRGYIINNITRILIHGDNGTISYFKTSKATSTRAFEALEELKNKIRYGKDLDKKIEKAVDDILSFTGYTG